MFDEFAVELGGRRVRRRGPRARGRRCRRLYQVAIERGLVLEVDLAAALGDFVERRLGDEQVAGCLMMSGSLAVEEGQQQRADVGAVDVGVGHDDDLVVAQLVEVELVADAGAHCLDQGADFL